MANKPQTPPDAKHPWGTGGANYIKRLKTGVPSSDVECMRLRESGKTYQQIADAMGMSKSACHTAVIRQLERKASELHESADVVRDLELDRLDKMLARTEALIAKIEDDDSIDDLVKLDAINKADTKILKLQDRRAKYLGLDAAKKTETTTTTVSWDAMMKTIDVIPDKAIDDQ